MNLIYIHVVGRFWFNIVLCVVRTYVWWKSQWKSRHSYCASKFHLYCYTTSGEREKKVKIIRHQLLMCVLLVLLERMTKTTTRTMMIMMSLLRLYMDWISMRTSVCANKMLCNTYRLSFLLLHGNNSNSICSKWQHVVATSYGVHLFHQEY